MTRFPVTTDSANQQTIREAAMCLGILITLSLRQCDTSMVPFISMTPSVEMKKFTWINTMVALVDQIRAALKQEFYPVFVSEGTSDEKLERIRHNDYLCKMYRSFTELRGAIVVYGHSLDESDDHIFTDRIGRHGKTSQLFVSLYGDPSSATNKGVMRRASGLARLRPARRPLEVRFFDAATASVWK